MFVLLFLITWSVLFATNAVGQAVGKSVHVSPIIPTQSSPATDEGTDRVVPSRLKRWKGWRASNERHAKPWLDKLLPACPGCIHYNPEPPQADWWN